MEGAILEQQDGISDYGSDFTPDEEEILNVLLQQAPAGSTTDLDLLLKDIEDDEGPRGARMHCTLGRERRHLSLPIQAAEKSLPIEVEWDNSSTPIGTLILDYHGNTK